MNKVNYRPWINVTFAASMACCVVGMFLPRESLEKLMAICSQVVFGFGMLWYIYLNEGQRRKDEEYVP